MNNIEILKAQISTCEATINVTETQIVSKQHEIDSFEYSCTETEYDNWLDEVYGDVNICGYTYSASQALENVDPTAYRCGKSDYESEYDLDNCEEYTDLQNELEELEGDLGSLFEELEELQDELSSLENQN